VDNIGTPLVNNLSHSNSSTWKSQHYTKNGDLCRSLWTLTGGLQSTTSSKNHTIWSVYSLSVSGSSGTDNSRGVAFRFPLLR
jgi:hypothetical protein